MTMKFINSVIAMVFCCSFCLKQTELIYTFAFSTDNVDTNENRQNIRHSRSRSHFIRTNHRISDINLKYTDSSFDKLVPLKTYLIASAYNLIPTISEYNLSAADEDDLQNASLIQPINKNTAVAPITDNRIAVYSNVKHDSTSTIMDPRLFNSSEIRTMKRDKKQKFRRKGSKSNENNIYNDSTIFNSTESLEYGHNVRNNNETDITHISESVINISDPNITVHIAVDTVTIERNNWDDEQKPFLRIEDRNDINDNNRNENIDDNESRNVHEDDDILDKSHVVMDDRELEADDFDNTIKSNEGTNPRSGHVDIVTRFLRIVESQHFLGENCTAGTDLNLGEGVVDRYAQERFRVEADVAVNRANMLTRLWKYSEPTVVMSEYLLHASVFSMVEFDDDIFAAGNCYDQYQYKDYWLFCPYAYRLPEGPILVKDLAVEYKYLSNTSEWFYIARKNAENVIRNYNQFSRGYNTYTWNETTHTERVPDEILSVTYEDGKWSKPYYDCGGGNIWMLTYTVPFFGYQNSTYYFKGTSGIDIDLRRVDIDQCPLPKGSTQLNIFAASDKCKKRTTECVPLPGLGFRRGSYKCVCRQGFYFPDTKAIRRYYNGTVIEEEYEKLMLGEKNQYSTPGVFECLSCAEECEICEDERPCVVSLNWVMRTVILILSCVVICCLPIVVLFTWKYGNVKVVRAASPVLLRVITLGACFIYCTTIVMYPRPNVYTCTVRVWLREIGFSLTYGALMLKTWRISVIFRVRSAKAVKITDLNLLKRLGVIVTVFSVLLVIRTLVAPPMVIVGRTADDLKAYLCRTDWWDHSFTTMEVLFLVWGIRLCIVVRKAPSEFNESRFISMAIYNEFLLSLFLNISMLFLQSPANPDLLYIILFCHTQLTVTLLLCLIFGSKAYIVFRGTSKIEESSGMMSKSHATKFLSKPRSGNSQYTSTNSSAAGLDYAKFSDQDVQDEFRRLYTQLELLKERNMRFGNKHLVEKISAMQEAALRCHNEPVSNKTIHTDIPCTVSGVASSGDFTKTNKTEPAKNENVTCAAVLYTVEGTTYAPEKHETLITNPVRSYETWANSETNSSTCLTCGASVAVTVHVNEEEKTHDLETNQEYKQSPISSYQIPVAVSTAAETSDQEHDTSSTDSKKQQTINGSTSSRLHTGNVNGAGNENRNGSENSCDKISGRFIKSGHARTHAIVINLDDKSRFTEEVTV